ncbi:MAG TPA: glycoside hydrolase family 3 C-terminal domain-containing protein, partial [Thermoanaerobaculia bacterium]|nr:glycoside hydrolase family 3 C-terminal domain-containing protein [Thermoanaerobaculia bacterium]
AVAQEIARRSLTLVREEPGALPLPRGRRIAHVVVSDTIRPSDELTAGLRARLAEPPSVFVLDPLSTADDVATTLAGAAAAEEVVVSLFVRFQSGKGSIAMPEAARPAVERILSGRVPAVVVVFGSPYVLREIREARTALLAWGSQSDAQAAVARALFGEAAIGGRLPVTIPGIAARGFGIPRPQTVR